jgi:hypothetical protein
MGPSTVNEIESQFAKLSPAIQLSLLERLARKTRENFGPSQDGWDVGLAAMAADPEMQRELSRTNSEFNAEKADGLGKSLA